MRDRKWLRCNAPKSSLHKGSFIPCKVTRGPVCNLTCLTLSACLLENVRICTPCASSKNSIAWSPSTSLLIILRVMHWRNSSVDTPSLVIAFQLITTCLWCLIASLTHMAVIRQVVLVVLSLSTMLVERSLTSLRCQLLLLRLSRANFISPHVLCQEGFNIKAYHSDTGIFAIKTFKSDYNHQQQTYTFSVVGAHH